MLHMYHKEKNEVKLDSEVDNAPVTVQTTGPTGEQDFNLSIKTVKVKSKCLCLCGAREFSILLYSESYG